MAGDTKNLPGLFPRPRVTTPRFRRVVTVEGHGQTDLEFSRRLAKWLKNAGRCYQLKCISVVGGGK